MKETPEGVDTVCKAMEEEKTVSNKENTLRIMLIVNAKSKFVLNRCQKAPYVISYTKEVRDIMKVRKYKNDPLELDRKLKGILKGNTDIELGYKLSFISLTLDRKGIVIF